MYASKLWSALALSCLACGSSFHTDDSSSAGDGSGGDGTGGELATAGSSSSGGRTSSGGASSGGVVEVGGIGVGGDISIGGLVGVGGDLGVGGVIGGGGVVGVGGIVGSGGGHSGGGIGGSGSAGAGGTAGAGSAAGTGGSAGASAGAGGSGGANCTSLWTTYSNLVTKAMVCDAGQAGECVVNSNIINSCSCAVPVNQDSPSYSDAEKALQTWKNAGCTTKACPCAAPGSPACTLSSGTSYVCTAGAVASPG